MKNTQLAVFVSAMAFVTFVTAGCNQTSTSASNSTNTVDNLAAPAVTTGQSNVAINSNTLQTALMATTDALAIAKKSETNGTQTVSVTPDESAATNYFTDDYSKKNDFVAAAKTGLDDLDQRTANFLRLISITPHGSNGLLQDKTQQINSQRADLGIRYDNIKSASAANWNDVKTAFVKSYSDFKAVLKSGEDSMTAKM